MLKRNVILITVDSLRADHLSCYGWHRKTSPNIDSLADTGIVFSQCISNSGYTLPSVVSFITSTYPLVYGGYKYLSEKRISIAEILKEKGYKTAAYIASNPFLSSKRKFDRGFDIFEEFELEMSRIAQLRGKFETFLKGVFNFVKPLYGILAIIYNYIEVQANTGEYHVRAETINQRAISWLKDNLNNNFFLWLHYMDTHYRYNPLQEYLGKFCSENVTNMEKSKIFWKMRCKPQSISRRELEILIDLYDGEIAYLDHCIGLLVNRLNDFGILRNTFIVITADHGEGLLEHGRVAHWDESLYDESIRVPLIVTGPEIKGGIVEKQVSLIDLAPTIVDLLKIPEVKNFQGRSLLPIVRGEEENSREVIIENKKKIAIRSDDWKYIFDRESGEEELYNLQADPNERINLSEIEYGIIEKFRSKLNTHLSMINETAVPLRDIELEEKVKDRLRRLGYIQ